MAMIIDDNYASFTIYRLNIVMNIIFGNSLLLTNYLLGIISYDFPVFCSHTIHALRFNYTQSKQTSLSSSSHCRSLGLDIGLVTANVLLKLQQLRRKLDFLLQEVLGIQVVLGGVVGVLFNVQADGGAGRAGARETDNDPAAGGEAGVQALVGGNGAVQVGVGEVASLGDGALCLRRCQFTMLLLISFSWKGDAYRQWCCPQTLDP